MPLKLLDLALCRTPAFAIEDGLEENWNLLKKMIGESSGTFYDVIKPISLTQFHSVDSKIAYSIWKYFNRAKYRATPFGTFAAFTNIQMLDNTNSPLIVNSEIVAHEFVDWAEKDYYQDLAREGGKTPLYYKSNSTLYYVGEQIRFVRIVNGVFEIASVNFFPELYTFLSHCQTASLKNALLEKMRLSFKISGRDLESLFDRLVTLQLLITNHLPNITGEDYFSRIDACVPPSQKRYIIGERKVISGSFVKSKLRHVSEMLKILSQLLPQQENKALKNFVKRFTKKFDQQLVPLLVALDPETGVGYKDLELDQDELDLNNLMSVVHETEDYDNPIRYGRLHKFLLNHMIDGDPIMLENYIHTDDKDVFPVPNTLSFVFRTFGELIVAENSGGCSATALLGRFTIASPELEAIGIELAAIETESNPGILFFDVAYQADREVDNVNRRRRLYQYELPILTWSSSPDTLDLNDILITVRNSEIILWSKSHGKRVVPRIPSAYNYNRSDLAIFCFLCDLQHYQLRSNLNFKIEEFFPSLKRYPRISYKNIILSAAMWKIPEYLFASKTYNLAKKKKELAAWLSMEGINFTFKAGHADQTLCFDPSSNTDMEAFLIYCRKSKNQSQYIKEALITETSEVEDNFGKKYAAEIIANYKHTAPVYKPYSELTILTEALKTPTRTLLPGGDWLYFEIYGHPIRSNKLLIERIAIFTKAYRLNISEWFFIRYNDPSPHIRLRIKFKKTTLGYSLISQFSHILSQDMLNGFISDLQIKTYVRELERYGAERINLVERFFYVDSKYALRLLSKIDNNHQLYNCTLIFMKQFISIFFNNMSDQLLFVKLMSDQFGVEFGFNNQVYKKLNHTFTDFNEHICKYITFDQGKSINYHRKTLLAILVTCQNEKEKTKMCADLIHMHINRLFRSDQRRHEAVLYYYLWKHLKMAHMLQVRQFQS